MENKKTWIRVAGHATNIKASHPHGWRCYVQGNPNEISLKDWSVNGAVSQRNFIPGVNAAGDEHGLVAWIDCYGNHTIDNEVLYINLQEPDAALSMSDARQ